MSTSPSSDLAKGSDTTLEKDRIETENGARVANGSDLSHDGNADNATDNAEAEKDAAPPAKNMMMDPSSFPDGGIKAWSTVFGAFCALLVSFGRSFYQLPDEAMC